MYVFLLSLSYKYHTKKICMKDTKNMYILPKKKTVYSIILFEFTGHVNHHYLQHASHIKSYY